MKTPLLILALLLGSTPVAAAKPEAAEDSIRVDVVGTLRTGIVAIGGETTGTTITANRVTWELDFGKQADLRARAEKLSGQRVRVTGILNRKQGVEIKQRWIVAVDALESAGAKRPAEDQDSFGLQSQVRRDDSRIEFIRQGNTTLVNIHSEFGIDRGTLRRTGDQWPEQIVLRLYLKGLESLQVASDGVSLEWFVESSGEHKSHCSLRKAQDETILDDDSPFYSAARIVGGNQTIPLKGGYFEVRLPAEFLAKNPAEIRVAWIDFYRN